MDDQHHQLTDEMIEKFREGCRLLAAMSPAEYWEGKSDRHRRFEEIDKALTWPLVDPGGPSVFDPELSGPCHGRPEGQTIDLPVAQQWQRALIEASGEVPRDFGPHPRDRREDCKPSPRYSPRSPGTLSASTMVSRMTSPR
jgi:hypothetical protein